MRKSAQYGEREVSHGCGAGHQSALEDMQRGSSPGGAEFLQLGVCTVGTTPPIMKAANRPRAGRAAATRQRGCGAARVSKRVPRMESSLQQVGCSSSTKNEAGPWALGAQSLTHWTPCTSTF